MDYFRENVESQTFALGAWDMLFCIGNMPFVFYFKNTNSDPAAPFMPADVLTKSLYHTLLEWPILAGHLVVNGRGRGFVVVDKDNLNLPDYQESESSVHYSAIEAARFSWGVVLPTVTTVPPFVANGPAGVVKMLNVHVVRLQDNSGVIIFANMPHYVTDGAGYSMFMMRWAETCKWMQAGSADELPARSLEFNRRAISRALPYEMGELSPAQSQLYTTSNPVGLYLSTLSPGALGDFFLTKAKGIPGKSHTFHITRATIDKLRKQITDANGASRRISDNDIICALVSHAVAKGMRDEQELPEVKELWDRPTQVPADAPAPAPDMFTTLVVADIRPRLAALGDANYAGGAVIMIPVMHAMDELADTGDPTKMISDASYRVREQVDGVTLPRINRFDYTFAKDTSRTMHLWSGIVASSQRTFVTNQSRFDHYRCDFGNGVPQWVSGPAATMPGISCVLPANPASDGYDLCLCEEALVMESILANEFWNAHTELVY
ncbi:hypothetical protein H4R21_000513 [Coemansia helicoidea]|uniref:Uncharacterized protein n=1 Tax=Coemansia helicoidea TaxID=1286919 RepID=A0ACC1LEX8_9FUNG|nr:hypothetical protein H4R21_000513 [Coemansia helicoidea]